LSSDVEKKLLTLPEQISVSGNDINGSGSMFDMSTSSGIIGINDAGTDAGVIPGSSLTHVSSQLNDSSDVVSITSAAQLLKDINCQIVDSRQMVAGLNTKDTQHESQTLDRVISNKPVRDKENIRPSSSRSGLPQRNARKCLDLENQPVDLCASTAKHGIQQSNYRESDRSDQFRSPLRLSTNNVGNVCSNQSQFFLQDGRGEQMDSNAAFSALSVLTDSFDSYADQHSPSKFSDDGLNTNSDGVHKRSSSTPVKDQTLQEPIRFRHQQHSSTADKSGQKQRKSSPRHLRDVSVPSEINAPVTQVNDQSATTQSAQGTLAQPDNTAAEMNPALTERLSPGALSSASLCDDSLIIADMTYESTVLMSLPAPVNAESTDELQDTSCHGVSTQTSLLLHSNDSNMSSPLISGNC